MTYQRPGVHNINECDTLSIQCFILVISMMNLRPDSAFQKLWQQLDLATVTKLIVSAIYVYNLQ